jgi:ribosome-associated protein
MERNLLHESILKNLRETFCRSGGKGGQNVNKLNTKVRVSVPAADLQGVGAEERRKLLSLADSSGEISVSAEDERNQGTNRKIAAERLEQKILRALAVKKKRKKTSPTKASRERRLKLKKIRGEIKRSREKFFW